LIFFILLIYAHFFWAKSKKAGDVNDFNILKGPEETIIENKREGLIFKIPNDLEIVKGPSKSDEGYDPEVWYLALYSPNREYLFKDREDLPFFKKGFAIKIIIDTQEGSIDLLHYSYNLYKKGAISICQKADEIIERFEKNHEDCALKIKGRVFLKDVGVEKEGLGVILVLKTPLNYYKALDIFFSCGPLSEKEFCYNQFQNFLDHIEFLK
jgi:hypothetical protein